MTHKSITAQDNITEDEVDELVNDHGWQFTRYYIDTCRWVRVCEPARDGQRAHLSGAIHYVERRSANRWERVLNTAHPATVEQIAIDQLRATAL